MKKNVILIALLLTSTLNYAADLKIKVKPFKEIKGAEYAITIDRYNPRSGYYTEMDDIYKNTSGVFNIEGLSIGRYMIAIMHPSSEILLYHIYVPEDSSKISLSAKLDNVVISKQIDSIRIVGKSNKWNHRKNHQYMQLDKETGLWKRNIKNPDADFGEFYFLLNRNEKTHSTELAVAEKDKPWADFHNYLEKGQKEIIFNPAIYSTEKHNYKVKIKGNNKNFHSLCKELDSLSNALMKVYSKTKTISDMDHYRRKYDEVSVKLNNLSETYKNELSWIFPNFKYRLLQFAPIEKEKYILYKSGKRSEYTALSKSEKSINVIKERALLLHSLNKNELMLTPELLTAISRISYPMRSNFLYEELNIPHGYFQNFLVDVSKEAKSEEILGEIAYIKAGELKRTRPEKSKQILNSILEKYPKYTRVKNGDIKEKLKGVSVIKGAKAPDFKLKTLDGKSVSLNDYKGKYVFLDFWGTWCGPCKAETPNIINLRKEIPKEDLVILAVACRDKKDTVKKYVKSKNVNYTNTMASSSIVKDYGVDSYPTTFLINKEGVIVEKNLRGSSLTERVKDLIK